MLDQTTTTAAHEDHARKRAELEHLARVKEAIRALLDATEAGWPNLDPEHRRWVLVELLAECLADRGSSAANIEKTLERVRSEVAARRG